MKILIVTDMEGVAGVLNHDDWVIPGGIYYEKGQRLLTEEANAAVDGFFTAGADEVVVRDGHGAGGLDPELLDERALLSRGPAEQGFPCVIHDTYDAVAFVGQHAKAGTPNSHITHTGWFDVIDMDVNGISIGEYGQASLCAMELGIPVILACGEEALCKEAQALTPGVVTVSGKRGLMGDGLDDLNTDEYRAAKLGALHKSPVMVRGLIREGARTALETLKKTQEAFKYPTLTPPYKRTRWVRQQGDKAAYTAVAEHPDSFIALMNIPF